MKNLARFLLLALGFAVLLVLLSRLELGAVLKSLDPATAPITGRRRKWINFFAIASLPTKYSFQKRSVLHD